MNKTNNDAVDRAEEVSATCDKLMMNPPNNVDGLMKSRAQMIEQIAELEALRDALIEKQKKK